VNETTRQQRRIAPYQSGGRPTRRRHPPPKQPTKHPSIGDFWDSVEDLRHEFISIWERDDVVVLEASIRYTKLDGEAVYIPVTTIIERDGETVTASRIYGDMAPLYDVDPDEAPLIC